MANLNRYSNHDWDELVVSGIARGFNKEDWGGMVGPGMEFDPPPISDCPLKSRPRTLVVDLPPGSRR
jgi:hypothetical protein